MNPEPYSVSVVAMPDPFYIGIGILWVVSMAFCAWPLISNLRRLNAPRVNTEQGSVAGLCNHHGAWYLTVQHPESLESLPHSCPACHGDP